MISMNFARRTASAAAAFCLAFSAGTVAAQTRSQVYGDVLTQQAQTVYVEAVGGMTTYESKAADSKEVRPSLTTAVGGWFGENRTIGMQVVNSDNTVPFELNDSKMHADFTDVRLQARIAWLFPSIGVSMEQVDVTTAGQKVVNVYGTGINAGLGFGAPVTKSIVVYGNGMAMKSTAGFDKLGGTAKFGDRQEADAGVSFDLTDRTVDLLIGYKIRQYDLEQDQVKLQERQEGAYAGLRVGLYF